MSKYTHSMTVIVHNLYFLLRNTGITEVAAGGCSFMERHRREVEQLVEEIDNLSGSAYLNVRTVRI